MTKRRMRNNKNRTLFKCGFFLYIGICLFTIIWLRTTVTSLEYEIGELDRMRSDLVRERKMAVAQRASFYATAKIENTAMKRLGMTLPDRENIYFVRKTSAAGPLKASMK